ncbi:MAG: cytochrome P460 family protein, partial [Burkholderiaceae bacterium]
MRRPKAGLPGSLPFPPSAVSGACLVAAAAWLAPTVLAADPEAGKMTVQNVCAACHGAMGVSVSDTIPNLAGQKAVYLETQLKALKDGSRKNPVMNAIAGQLNAQQIADVAAFFAAQPGASGTARSEFLPNLSRSRVTFPDDYQNTFVRYHTINFPATRQVRHYFANSTAIRAAQGGQTVPDGAVMLVEVHSAKLGDDGKPVTGSDGFFVADKLLFYTAMARDAGWGNEFPEVLRNEDWNYAVFTTAKQPR